MPLLCIDDDLIAGDESIQIAEDFAVDIIVRREYHVSIVTWIWGANIFADSLLELFPPISLHNRRIYVERRDLNADGLVGR